MRYRSKRQCVLVRVKVRISVSRVRRANSDSKISPTYGQGSVRSLAWCTMVERKPQQYAKTIW
eukprot:scaffold40826_cov33-Prasinocladus_malaysianus.AAC.1